MCIEEKKKIEELINELAKTRKTLERLKVHFKTTLKMVPRLRNGNRYKIRRSEFQFMEFKESKDSSGNWFGKEHSIDLDGVEVYRLNGMLHSENDHWAKKYPDGTTEWYYKGELHRFNGPAIIKSNGELKYYKFGEEVKKKHKLDVVDFEFKSFMKSLTLRYV